MPEGPEIWRVADQLSEILKDRTAEEIFFYHEELKPYAKQLRGQRVTGVEPRGKAIVTRFENGLHIYSHNQLYGKWKITERGVMPDTNRSLRLKIANENGQALLYSASEIEVLESGELKDHPYLEKLGPDVLHPETTLEEVRDRFRDENFVNRKLSTLLLDQGFLSGLGNYLRAEIMFAAGIPPSYKLRQCSDEQVEKLAEATLKLARRSYETGGVTTDPKTVEALKREGSPRENYRHYVYGREGDYCHKCGAEVRSDKTGGRKLYYCSSCQSEEE